MSYRSLKRVFGETKLELKLVLLFAVGFGLVIVSAFWYYGRKTADMLYEQNQHTAQMVLGQDFFSKHLGVGKEGNNRPSLFPPTPEDVKKDREWAEELRKSINEQPGKVDWLCSKVPYSAGSAPKDEAEARICEQLLKPPEKALDKNIDPSIIEHKELLGSDEYRYFEPIRAQESCLLCHNSALGGAGIDDHGTGISVDGRPTSSLSPPLSAGDVIAIAKVTIPYARRQHRLDENWALLWATAILTVFLGMLTSYAIVRYVIVKPLRHLRDVSDAVTRGDLNLRAEIHTGDEFEELSKAFNRMLRSLVTIQDELRQANVNLDSKVDELAQVNMRLYEMNLLKSDFLATMSHELRTPLNSILGFSEVLGGISALDDKQKRYVQNIQKSGRTLLEMINDILDLAKMESGKMEVRPSEFRIEQVVGAQCDMARPLAEKKNIDLETELDLDVPPMRQDQARVQQILNNLLSNAIKFTPEGGRVTIRVRLENDFMLMQVDDTGVGIAEEDQQVIFEKFRQGRVGVPTGDAMTREYSGSGLGLSIVKELCKLLGGSVSVTSELGKGSTFTVRLPWTLQDGASTEAVAGDGYMQFANSRFD
jgi:signal transduction histidine kinase